MEQNETCGALANATLLSPVTFCQNLSIPICNALSGPGGPARNRHGSNIVETFLLRLPGVDDTRLRQKLGLSILI